MRDVPPERKLRLGRALKRIAIAASLAIASAVATAATRDPLVVDWRTGLALYGFDPVAYFTDAKPLIGRGEIEYAYSGAVWHFRNIGNRAAFVEHPDVYQPQFGGYDPISLARGAAAPGHPYFWLVSDQRLYLFQSSANRDLFAADAAPAIAAARANWPDVVKTLIP